MAYPECPIHKVAKTDRISGNECLSCEFLNSCPNDVLDSLEEKMIKATAVAVDEIRAIIKRNAEKQ